MAPKQIRFALLETPCTGGYMVSGQWKDAADNSKTKDRLDYWTTLAKKAEQGKFSCIFLADWYAGHEVYGGSMDVMLRTGHQVAHLDPMLIISAMAAVTDSLGLAVTSSTSYVNPYILARQMSTLDHLTNGRAGWNIVTSWSKAAAAALGFKDVATTEERYEIAEEYMDVVYKLWESSWASDAPMWDAESGVAYEPSKVKKIIHDGKWHHVAARNQVHPSPQRTPVLFQAGTSKSGAAFAAKHAEAIFINTPTIAQCKKVIVDTRAAVAANGRDPASITFWPAMVPYLGKTEEEAQAAFDTAKKNADYVAGLGQLSSYLGLDLSIYPVDEPFAPSADQPNMVQGVMRALQASHPSGGAWTPRELGYQMALGGLNPCPIGSASQVADVIEEWVREADVDGFNLSFPSSPAGIDGVIDLLIPELQRRGLYWKDYDVPGGAFRENLFGKGHTELSEDHYGSTFKWDKVNN